MSPESGWSLRKGATPPTHDHDRPYQPCRNVHIFAAATVAVQTEGIINIIVKTPMQLINAIALRKAEGTARDNRTLRRPVYRSIT